MFGKRNLRKKKSMVPVDEDGIRDGDILSLSDDDSVHEQKENIAALTQTRNLGRAIIDLTDDSPPKSPVLSGSYKFNQIVGKPQLGKCKNATPEGKISLKNNKRQTPIVGRYGVAKGAIYTSDSSDGCDTLSGLDNEREKSRELSKKPLQNLRESINICDSDEDSKPDVLSKDSVSTTSHSRKSHITSVFHDITQSPGNSLDTASTLDNQSLATDSNHTLSLEGHHRSEVKQNNEHLHKTNWDPNARTVTSKDERSYLPVTSGSKDTPPLTQLCPNFCCCCSPLPTVHNRASVDEIGNHDASNTNNNVDTSVLNDIDGASTSHPVLDWNAPSSSRGTTYEDLLASYAAYDSDDDDRMSFTMGSTVGSPQSPECLDNEDPYLPSKIAESEQDAYVQEVNVVSNPLPSTSATSEMVPVFPSNRVLRIRTTIRITQKMMQAKRTAKKKIIPSPSPTPDTNSSASDQAKLDLPTKKQRGRPRKIKSPSQPSVGMDSGMKKAKVVVESEPANQHDDENDETTPERAKLKQEITAMASELKKVSALAARAAQLEKDAMEAKQKESLAVQKAQEASEKLNAVRLEHVKVLKVSQEKAKIEQAEKDRKAKEEEKEKEKAASEARAKSWECPVCLEPRSASTQLSVTPCGHVFCKPCIVEVGNSKAQCPLCNQVFTNAQVMPLFFNFTS